ncbi:MAG: hypothetical protein JXB26_19870 [Candidatus Aminicenantes bacterium]|nr:hypothetical protein [Candidatus Aminicenantes bacterium]
MRSKDLADEIDAFAPKRDDLRKRLDSLIVAYRPHLASIAETWIREEVDRRLKDHAKQIAEMGIDRIKQLKSKVEGLIASLPDVVQEETSQEADWPHNRSKNDSGYGQDKNEPFFKKAFRNMISRIAAVWDEFDLLGEPTGYTQCWERLGSGRFRYAFNPGFEVLDCDTLAQYSTALREYQSLVNKIEMKQKEMEEAKAKELWESA